MTRNVKTGKDSVVIGDISGEVGDGSVVIGPTDDRGNTVINQPMAAGRGAAAGPNSIAIGAGASAGSDIFHYLRQLKNLPEAQSNQALLVAVEELRSELEKDCPDSGTLRNLWSSVQHAATAGGAISLAQAIGKMLGF